MPLEPLGHKDPLLPPSSLGQSFQSQQSLLPLGQSLTPLGQRLESPLPDASFPGTEIPTLMSSFSEPMGANAAFADRTTARITSESNQETQPSVSSAPIRDIPNLGSNSFESQGGNPPTVSGRWQEDEFVSDTSNTPSSNSPNAVTDNLVSRKPLGLSKPLAQESDFLTSPFTAEFLEQPRTSSQQIPTASPESSVSKPLVVQGRLETQLPPDPPTTAVETAKPSVEPVSGNSEAIASPPLPTGSERTSDASTPSKSSIVQPSLETKTPSPTNLAPTSSLTEASREDSGASLPQSAPEVPESRPSQATDSQPSVVQPRLETGNSAPTQQIAPASPPTEISIQQSEAPVPPSALQLPEPKPSQATDSQPTVVQPRLETETPAPTNLAATSLPTEISTQESEAPTPQSTPEVPESRPSQATDSQPTVVQPRLRNETPAPTNLAATSSPTEISTPQSEAPVPPSALQLPEPKPSQATDSQPTVVQPRLETETAAPTNGASTSSPTETSTQESEAPASPSALQLPIPKPSAVTDSQPTVVQPRLETETAAPMNLAATSSPTETSTQESEAPAPQPAPEVSESRPQAAAPSQPTVIQPQLETETAAPTATFEPAAIQGEASSQQRRVSTSQSALGVSESPTPEVTDSVPNVVQPRRETETSTSTPTFEPAALQGEASSQQRRVSTSQSVPGVSESPAPEVTDSVPNVVQPRRETETSTSTPNIAPASPPIEASTQDSEAPIPPLAPQVLNSRPLEATDSQPTVVQASREAETAAPTPNIAPASPLTDTSREDSDAIAPQTAPEVPESTSSEVTNSQIVRVQPGLETETSESTMIVQPRLDKESLPLLNPLGLSKPLAQQSDFFTSGLLAEFLAKQSTSPQEVPETPSGRSPKKRSRSTSAPLTQLPEVNVPSSLSTPGSQPSRVPSAPITDVPDSWSSLSELLGESSTATADSRSWEDEFASLVTTDREFNRSEAIANSQESVTLGTENQPSSPGTTPISISSPATSKQPTADKEREDSIEEQLEILAQKIYSLIRQRLEIDKERQGHYCTGHPPWLDTLDPKSSNTASPTSARNPQTAGQLTASLNGEVSSLDGKLEILTQEVYNLLRLRLEIERERENIYY